MARRISIKQNAIKLRQDGFSIKEIARILNLSSSTSSIWLRNVSITPDGQKRMTEHKELNRYKMSQVWIQKRKHEDSKYKILAIRQIKNIDFAPSYSKILCSILFWAEGSKRTNHVAFTNSDPLMISTFLKLLRETFALEESKFSVSVHLHEYHNPEEILQFWSIQTKIPLSNFIKPYLKPHTGLRKKNNYMGCITVRYYDVKIARELTAIYNELGEKFRGVVQGQDSSLQKK